MLIYVLLYASLLAGLEFVKARTGSPLVQRAINFLESIFKWFAVVLGMFFGGLGRFIADGINRIFMARNRDYVGVVDEIFDRLQPIVVSWLNRITVPEASIDVQLVNATMVCIILLVVYLIIAGVLFVLAA